MDHKHTSAALPKRQTQ